MTRFWKHCWQINGWDPEGKRMKMHQRSKTRPAQADLWRLKWKHHTVWRCFCFCASFAAVCCCYCFLLLFLALGIIMMLLVVVGGCWGELRCCFFVGAGDVMLFCDVKSYAWRSAWWFEPPHRVFCAATIEGNPPVSGLEAGIDLMWSNTYGSGPLFCFNTFKAPQHSFTLFQRTVFCKSFSWKRTTQDLPQKYVNNPAKHSYSQGFCKADAALQHSGREPLASSWPGGPFSIPPQLHPPWNSPGATSHRKWLFVPTERCAKKTCSEQQILMCSKRILRVLCVKSHSKTFQNKFPEHVETSCLTGIRSILPNVNPQDCSRLLYNIVNEYVNVCLCTKTIPSKNMIVGG